MGRQLRFVPERSLVEVTCRTLQGRFLLKPFPGWRDIFVGALARAQSLYKVEIHAFVCLSNHLHLLLSPQDARELAAFMRHVLSKLAIEAGRRHRWRGPLFQRRYQAIVVSDESRAQLQRLRYLLAHGVKENLVARVVEWPGPHCAQALIEGTPLRGVWHDRTGEWLTRHRGQRVEPREFEAPYELLLSPLPCWQGLSPAARRRHARELIHELETEAANHRRSRALPYLGVRAVLDQDPHAGPASPKRSPAPRFHACASRVRRGLHKAYGLFLAAYRDAARRLAEGDRSACFPHGSFPPPIPFRWAAARAAPSPT